MLPYFDEYKVYLSNNMNNTSAKTQTMRLVKLDRAKKNLLEMSAQEMLDILEVNSKSRTSLNSVFSIIESYLRWLDSEYKIPIYECFYQVKKLKALGLKINGDNTINTFFVNFEELKSVLLKAENDYLATQELEVSNEKLDGIYIKQKMFNAYAVFLWEQMSNDEILNLSLKEIMFVITSKQIVVNSKLVDLPDNEVEFINEAFNTVTKLHQDIENRRMKSKVNKRKFTTETYDNLFNASNINILRNLKWNALGNSVSDQRLQVPNIIKAGIFYKLAQYEITNDYVFYGEKSFEVCSELLGISLTKAQRYICEYNKFKCSLENKDNITDNI